MKFLTNLDLQQNQLIKAVVQNVAGLDGVSGKEGQIIYNTVDDMLYIYKALGWEAVGKDMTAQQILDLVKTVDGDGSGLDADLLDGKHASDFSLSGHTHLYAGSSTAGGAANSVANSLTLKIDSGTTEGTDLYTFNGSAGKTVDFKSGTNVTLTDTAGVVTFSSPSLALGATVGTGNAVTDVSVAGHTITLTKGSTFSLDGHTHSTYDNSTALTGANVYSNISVTDGIVTGLTSRALTAADISAQPADADLTAIAGLAGTTGLLKKTAANTWELDTNTYYLASNPNGYTTNTGTVTSVGLSAPTGFSVASSPITGAGTIALSFATGYSLPTDAKQTNWDGAYTHSTTTTGSVHGSTTVGGNLLRLTNPSAISFLRVNADNTVTTLDAASFRTAIGAGTGNGTVTSVSGETNVVNVATGTTTPVITLATAFGDTKNPYGSKTANYVLAAPNGSAGVPSFRALVSADIPDLDAAKITSGTLPIVRGGTGQTTATAAFDALAPTTTLGDIIYRNGTGNTRLAGNITTTKQVLTQTGTGSASAAPVWGTLTYTDVGAAASGHNHDSVYVNVSGDTMTGALTLAADPTQALHAATKQYVDAMAQGIYVKSGVDLATNDTLVNMAGGASPVITYANGTSGVGATLTLSGTYTNNFLADAFWGDVTAYTPAVGVRVLVKNQASAVQNGIYEITSGTVLTRTTDFDSDPDVEAGAFVFVSDGPLAKTGWVQTATVNVIGTDPIVFEQFSGAGVYAASEGIELVGNTFSHTNAVTASSVVEGGVTRTLAFGGSFNIPGFNYDAQGHLTDKTTAVTLTLPAAPAAPNNGTLTLGINGTAGATNSTVTVATGTGFSANTATNTTYDLKIGPALTALAGVMTGATTGFLKKTAADTFTLDTNTYLTSQSTDFKTIEIDNTETEYTWVSTDGTQVVAETVGDTLKMVASKNGASTLGIKVLADATNDAIGIAHADTSTLSGAQGSTGIASVTVDDLGHVTAVTTATYMRRYSSDFGDATAGTITYNLTHGLGTADLVVTIYEKATNAVIYADVVVSSTQISITLATGPGVNALRVVAIG